jgi:hypothetical protein
VALTGDDGGSSPGFLMHHGILELPDGGLLATMYGNHKEDMTDDNRTDGYPPSFGMYKSRVIVVCAPQTAGAPGDASVWWPPGGCPVVMKEKVPPPPATCACPPSRRKVSTSLIS